MRDMWTVCVLFLVVCCVVTSGSVPLINQLSAQRSKKVFCNFYGCYNKRSRTDLQLDHHDNDLEDTSGSESSATAQRLARLLMLVPMLSNTRTSPPNERAFTHRSNKLGKQEDFWRALLRNQLQESLQRQDTLLQESMDAQEKPSKRFDQNQFITE